MSVVTRSQTISGVVIKKTSPIRVGLVGSGGSGGIQDLTDLRDVDASSLSDGSMIVYDATSGKFETTKTIHPDVISGIVSSSAVSAVIQNVIDTTSLNINGGYF